MASIFNLKKEYDKQKQKIKFANHIKKKRAGLRAGKEDTENSMNVVMILIYVVLAIHACLWVYITYLMIKNWTSYSKFYKFYSILMWLSSTIYPIIGPIAFIHLSNVIPLVLNE